MLRGLKFATQSWGEGWFTVIFPELAQHAAATGFATFKAVGTGWMIGAGVGSLIGAAIDWQVHVTWDAPEGPECNCP